MTLRVNWKQGLIAIILMITFYIPFGVIGCASISDGTPDAPKIIGDIGQLEPAKLKMAGMVFAWTAPLEAQKLSGACAALLLFTDEGDILDYINSKLTKDYFANMTPEQAEITKEFIASIAKDAGIDIDFSQYLATIGDNFSLDRVKAAVSAVCQGIKAGLSGS